MCSAVSISKGFLSPQRVKPHWAENKSNIQKCSDLNSAVQIFKIQTVNVSILCYVGHSYIFLIHFWTDPQWRRSVEDATKRSKHKSIKKCFFKHSGWLNSTVALQQHVCWTCCIFPMCRFSAGALVSSDCPKSCTFRSTWRLQIGSWCECTSECWMHLH